MEVEDEQAGSAERARKAVHPNSKENLVAKPCPVLKPDGSLCGQLIYPRLVELLRVFAGWSCCRGTTGAPDAVSQLIAVVPSGHASDRCIPVSSHPQQEVLPWVWGQETHGTSWQGQQAAEAGGSAAAKPLLHRHRSHARGREQEGQTQLREGGGQHHLQCRGGSRRVVLPASCWCLAHPRQCSNSAGLDLLAQSTTRHGCSRVHMRCLVHCRCAVLRSSCNVVCWWC